jgi:GH24 family phage-related lysozyme (muramidase)
MSEAERKQHDEEKAKGKGCTIGYGHVITAKERKCWHNTNEGDSSQEQEEKEKKGKKKPAFKLVKCSCDPPWILPNEKAAHDLLVKDIAAVAKWMKQNVLVDLDQAHFDALVDLGLHHGSIPKSLLDVIHAKICKDDDAVREEYLRTSLGVKGKPKQGAKFGSRREERVWPKQSDEDPDCI